MNAFCIKPIFTKLHGWVPCGKCPICVNFQKRDWIKRCLMELPYNHYSWFVTLTINNENLHNVNYQSVQGFLKRLRRRTQFKYFGCFEKGTRSNRPHFHLCIFTDNEKLDPTIMRKLWHFGFVDIKYLTMASISYVCGYTMKKFDWSSQVQAKYKNIKMFSKLFKSDTLFNRQPYFFMSKGLGKRYCMEHISQILDNQFIALGGYKYSVPRAFVRWLGVDWSSPELLDDDAEKFQNKILNTYNNLRGMYEKKTLL